MGVKRQWRLMKIAELPLAEEVKRDIIDKIIRQRDAKLTLYCWENKNSVAPEAFFSKQDAVKNWYVKNRLWEQESIPKGVLLYEWNVSLKTIVDMLKDNKLCNMPISEEHTIEVALSLQKLHEEIKQTVQKQA